MKGAAQHDQASGADAAAADAELILCPGETCWRRERTHRFGLIVDAADYFAAARSAMLKAQSSIVLIGWDFDLRIDLTPDKADSDISSQLGPFLKGLVQRNPDLKISILKWDMSVLFAASTRMFPMFMLDLATVNRIRLRFDSHHPWTAAHHQKIAVVDDALAFCGGIDMTVDRWDTREHRPGDARRKRPDGEIAGPWHDATALVDGDAAKALGELARERWFDATGQRLPPATRRTDGGDDLWPDEVEPRLHDVDVAIARTFPAYDGRPPVREIEALYKKAIRSARNSIYLESQYFASSTICELIRERLREPDGPEIVVVNPLSTDGWLEQQTMGTARDLQLRAIAEADPHGRFGIFHPVNEAGEPIYVHAKVLIVDDKLIRVGSSNVNNRSMGFDTECDLAIEAGSGEERATITAIRNDLLAEHLELGRDEMRSAIKAHGSILKAVNTLRRPSGRSLRPIPIRETNDVQESVARSHLADPETAKNTDSRIAHLAKSLLLRRPAYSLAGLATFSVVLALFLTL